MSIEEKLNYCWMRVSHPFYGMIAVKLYEFDLRDFAEIIDEATGNGEYYSFSNQAEFSEFVSLRPTGNPILIHDMTKPNKKPVGIGNHVPDVEQIKSFLNFDVNLDKYKQLLDGHWHINYPESEPQPESIPDLTVEVLPGNVHVDSVYLNADHDNVKIFEVPTFTTFPQEAFTHITYNQDGTSRFDVYLQPSEKSTLVNTHLENNTKITIDNIVTNDEDDLWFVNVLCHHKITYIVCHVLQVGIDGKCMWESPDLEDKYKYTKP